MDIEFTIQFRGVALSDAERDRLRRALREVALRELTSLEIVPDKLRIEMGNLVDGIVVRNEL